MKRLFYKSKITTAVLLVFLVCFFSCKICREQEVITFDKFGDYYYNVTMGFEGNEWLTFIKNNKDTVVFKGQGLETFYTEVEYTRSDCEATYRLLNHKVRFINQIEGELLFHYYIYTPADKNSEAFELSFKTQQFVGPILASDYYDLPYDTTNGLVGCIRSFATNKGDSIYLNNPGTWSPHERIFRIKSGNNLYEVVP